MKAPIIILDCDFTSVCAYETNYIKEVKEFHPKITQHIKGREQIVYIYKIDNILCFEKEPDKFKDLLDELANKNGYVILSHPDMDFSERRLVFSGGI